MKKFIFILGGAKSGKSQYAVKLAKSLSKNVAFIATGDGGDKEMKKRIEAHKRSRPKHWKLIEEGKGIDTALRGLDRKCDVAIIDCGGLFISNLLLENLNDKEIEKRTRTLSKAIKEFQSTTILVSNETGLGIVPDNPLARRFRDSLGAMNQWMAREADEVFLMHAGIPMKIKG